ncbi:hypothetical protein ABIB62_000540 [Mucilaginibacter sp. UYP25]|uniref:hypothetical protein n=1 Tax=unclassified Mucilaginibacter TaxID=2617802 RepID=UPI003396A8BC
MKDILMISNRFTPLRDLISAPFRYIINLIVVFRLNNIAETLIIVKNKFVYMINDIKNTKTLDKAFIFIQNKPKFALNTATVYINVSNCDLIKPASAYRLHLGLVLFS